MRFVPPAIPTSNEVLIRNAIEHSSRTWPHQQCSFGFFSNRPTGAACGFASWELAAGSNAGAPRPAAFSLGLWFALIGGGSLRERCLTHEVLDAHAE